jgi:hypothetical protein
MPGLDPIGADAKDHSASSCAGLTRASIVLRTGWIAGSSPAMTDGGIVSPESETWE